MKPRLKWIITGIGAVMWAQAYASNAQSPVLKLNFSVARANESVPLTLRFDYLSDSSVQGLDLSLSYPEGVQPDAKGVRFVFSPDDSFGGNPLVNVNNEP